MDAFVQAIDISSVALYFDFFLECIPLLIYLCLAFMFACHCLLGCSVVLCVVAPEWLVVKWLPFVLLFLQFMRRACLLDCLLDSRLFLFPCNATFFCLAPLSGRHSHGSMKTGRICVLKEIRVTYSSHVFRSNCVCRRTFRSQKDE